MHMLVYNEQFIIQYARYEHKSKIMMTLHISCLYIEPTLTFYLLNINNLCTITLYIYCTGMSLNIHHTEKHFQKMFYYFNFIAYHAGSQFFLRQSVLDKYLIMEPFYSSLKLF